MASARNGTDLNAMARQVDRRHHYMTLGTRDPDGRSRLSPVYYTCDRYSCFPWVSAAQAQHSRNIEQCSAVDILIFDSTASVAAAKRFASA
jgi:hypothetical protein